MKKWWCVVNMKQSVICIFRFLCKPETALRFPLRCLKGWSTRGNDPTQIVATTVSRLSCDQLGTVHAIAVWLQLPMAYREMPNIVDTGPFVQDAQSHWRQICFLLEEPLSVNAEDILKVEVILDISCGIWCRVLYE